MNLSEKIKRLLALRKMTANQLGKAAGISRATMSRIMNNENHRLADHTIEKIADILEVSVGYIRGGYVMPPHLTEDDVLFFSDLRNVPYIKLVKGFADRGVSAEDLRKLVDIILSTNE